MKNTRVYIRVSKPEKSILEPSFFFFLLFSLLSSLPLPISPSFSLFSSGLAPVPASLGDGRPPPVQPSPTAAKSDQKQLERRDLSPPHACELLAHPPSHDQSLLCWLAPPSTPSKPQPARFATSAQDHASVAHSHALGATQVHHQTAKRTTSQVNP